MPYPQKGESKDQYIKRCIPYMIKNEGKEKDQAVAMCYAFWDEYQPKESKMDIINRIDNYLKEAIPDKEGQTSAKKDNLNRQIDVLRKSKERISDKKKKADIDIKIASIKKTIASL